MEESWLHCCNPEINFHIQNRKRKEVFFWKKDKNIMRCSKSILKLSYYKNETFLKTCRILVNNQLYNHNNEPNYAPVTARILPTPRHSIGKSTQFCLIRFIITANRGLSPCQNIKTQDLSVCP